LSFQPGDPVRHLYAGEEGVVKSLHLFRVGTNAGDSLLVTVGKEEKVWLPHEVEKIDSTNKNS